MSKNSITLFDDPEAELNTIAKALSAWGLKVDLSGKDFEWDKRDASCPDNQVPGSCKHARTLSFKEFLNTNTSHFGGQCQLFDLDPSGKYDDVDGLFSLAHDIQWFEHVDADSDFREFVSLASRGLEVFLNPEFVGLSSEQDLQDLFEERMKLKFEEFPEQFRKVLLYEISQDELWEVPEQAVDPDPLVYIYTGTSNWNGKHSPGRFNFLGGKARLFDVFCTKLAKNLYLVPKRFLRLRSTNEKDFENNWLGNFASSNSELEKFYSLCGRPVPGVVDVKESDNKKFFEALTVFMNEMPFVDAVNAARVI